MTLRLNGSTSGYTEIDAPASAGNNTLVLPSGNGAAHQLLKNGATAGSLDWGFTLPSTNGSSSQALVGDGAGALNWQWNAGTIYYRLNSTLLGLNSTASQKLLGVDATLTASTVYAIDGFFVFAKSAGTTTHGIQLGFGGTASINNLMFEVNGWHDNGNSTLPFGVQNTVSPAQIRWTVGGSVTAISAVPGNITAAAVGAVIRTSGTVSINAGGTFGPRYELSAAPGGAYAVQTGSWIRFTPIGAAGSASSQGTWS